MTAPVENPGVPLCTCHGEPMFWHKDSRRKRGGYWQCKVWKSVTDSNYRDRVRRDPVTVAWFENAARARLKLDLVYRRAQNELLHALAKEFEAAEDRGVILYVDTDKLDTTAIANRLAAEVRDGLVTRSEWISR